MSPNNGQNPACTRKRSTEEDVHDLEVFETNSECSDVGDMEVSKESASEESFSSNDSDDSECLAPYKIILDCQSDDEIVEDEEFIKEIQFASEVCELHTEELGLNEIDVEYLDLAENRSVGMSKWRRIVRFEGIRHKCSELTEDRIKQLDVLDDMNKICSLGNSVYYAQLHDLYDVVAENEDIFFKSYLPHFLDSLDDRDKKSKRRSILRFIWLTNIPSIYSNDREYILQLEVYFLLMYHIRKDFHDDSKFVIYVLHNLCRLYKVRMAVFMKEDKEGLEFLIGHALKQRYNFWCMYDEESSQYLPRNALSSCMAGNRNTEIFLKYGFPYTFSESSFKYICDALCEATIFGQAGDFERSWLILDEYLQTLLEHHKANFRTQMVVQVLLALVHSFTRLFDVTLIRWSRAIKEPYVLPREIYELMKDYVKPRYIATLRNVCILYENSRPFDDDHTVMAPRKLSHLCRYTLRKELQKNYTLPAGIEKLPIPKDSMIFKVEDRFKKVWWIPKVEHLRFLEKVGLFFMAQGLDLAKLRQTSP